MIIAHSEAKALLVSDKLFTKLSRKTVDSLNIVIRSKNLGVISRVSMPKANSRCRHPMTWP